MSRKIQPVWWNIKNPGAPILSSYDRVQIGPWNVRSFNGTGRFRCHMEHMKLDILGIFETHRTGPGEFTLRSSRAQRQWRVFISGGEQHRQGVARKNEKSNEMLKFSYIFQRWLCPQDWSRNTMALYYNWFIHHQKVMLRKELLKSTVSFWMAFCAVTKRGKTE